MQVPEPPTAPTSKEVCSYKDEFTVQDDAGVIFKVRWELSPSIPTANKSGANGWATRDGVSATRLHVCANTPCSAVYPASKYGDRPPPKHARLVAPAPLAAAESATHVALPTPAAGSAEMEALQAVVVTTTAAPPEPSPATAAPQVSAVAEPEADLPDVSHPNIGVLAPLPSPDSIAPAEVGPIGQIPASEIADICSRGNVGRSCAPGSAGRVAINVQRSAFAASRGASCF